MKVATLEKFHLRGGGGWGGNQDPGDPGVGFFSFKQGGGTDPGWHYAVTLLKNEFR